MTEYHFGINLHDPDMTIHSLWALIYIIHYLPLSCVV